MSLTPLMSQFYKIKNEHPDTILLFRVGDFYETFDEDAKTASKVLGITLTKRSNGAAGDVPLAGFPHHAIDTYLPKLVKSGFRVAICDQVEDPKFAKGLVKREVTEVISPGVAFSEKLLDHKSNNYLAAFYIHGNKVGISFSDISTAEFYAYEVNESNIVEQIIHINPAEILIPKKHQEYYYNILKKINANIKITKTDDWLFNFDFAFDLLTEQFQTKNLKGFGISNLEAGVISAGAILNYLNETQKSNISHISKINHYNPSDYMMLDLSTKRNLEITFSIQQDNQTGTLLSVLDHTITPMGGRLLKKWISAPLKNLEKILLRQIAVEELVINEKLRANIISELEEISDLERLISKACTGRVTPRDLISLKSSLKKIPLLNQILDTCKSETLLMMNTNLKPLDELVEKIDLAINDTAPGSIGEGGIIKSGYNSELDELRDLSLNAKNWIANLQKQEREKTSIQSLKINYNKVFGYYIEISNSHKDKIPENYIRKQTLVNSERYITPELKEYEDKILNAEEKIAELEFNLFDKIRQFIIKFTNQIQENAKIISQLDCYYSLAETAVEYNYVKPLVNRGKIINIKEGRHPVIERILPHSEKFTPNDTLLDNDSTQIIILTGPNMAGKSVFLRQIGLIVLLAQIGSFVPAESAEIGIVDRIFTRVGASDNISAGESTFLVEMQEASNILNNATSNSLILLDEIGRGTSTFDGISIAWAITEYIHENPEIRAKTLFATHYHELNEMSSIFPRIKNFKVDVKEIKDKVIFLHKVSEGGADHSYGIQVAQMSGMPEFVTKRAKEILSNLESKELTPLEIKKAKILKNQQNEIQYNLFEFTDDKFRKEIRDIDIDSLTPIEALNKLNELKKKV